MVEPDDLRRINDRFAIHDALLRYARGVDRLDAELINSAYHADAEDYRGSPVPAFTGATAGTVLVGRLATGCDSSFHSLTNLSLDIDGDAAWSESYFQVWQAKRQPDGTTRRQHVCGRYVDRFERRDGDWRIARRICLTDYANVFMTAAGEEPAIPVNGIRSREDPSYDRNWPSLQ
jgi:hypothetical protein